MKNTVKRLPYPLLLRTYYAWFLAGKLLRFERIRRQLGIPRLSSIDLAARKTSDTLFILGSGPSINRISRERWEWIARHDTLAVNLWLFHWFVPKFYVTESASYGGARDLVSHRLVDIANRRAPEYRNTIKIITDLYEPGRQYVFDLNPDFRTNLYAAYNIPLPAREEREFEMGVRYLEAKGFFRPTGHIAALFKYSLSLPLLLTFALRLQYRKVVLCGFDMTTQDYFYQDPELYPESRGLAFAAQGVPHGANRPVPWMLPQSTVVYEMQRLLLAPAGVELFVENRCSALWPRVPALAAEQTGISPKVCEVGL